MKKTLLTASLLLLSATLSFGQKALVEQAWSLAKKAEKPDFKAARNTIQEALAGESAEDVKAWYVAGNIEQRFFEKENEQAQFGMAVKEAEMDLALENGYKYYRKAVALDTLPNAKGKVKPKYIKNIQKDLLANSDGYINAGVRYFNAQEYMKAYEMWNIFIEIRDLPFMASMAKQMPADSIYAMLEYNAALAALNTGDRDLTLKALLRAKGNGYEQNNVYKFIVGQYEIAQDTANLVSILNEGNELFSNLDVVATRPDGTTFTQKENYYSIRLINLYIAANEYEKAVNFLNEVVANDPENPELWNVKGQLLEAQGDIDGAIDCFKKAIDMNPNFALAIGNIGRVYYNQGVGKDLELSEKITNTTEFNAAKEAEVLPLYRKALPYLEKAHQLDPNERDHMVALRTIYYNLNDAKNLKLIEMEMGF
ncbi:MAG: tetratricopeptide repeat protein [Bacteroidaceae bacterium]|nr:tetratricopeptide repeat protein [Bacteroidaceae bacterium]